jgi:hypothetical protein
MSVAAPLHAARFSWEVTVDGLLASYARALSGLGPAPDAFARSSLLGAAKL